MVILMKRLLLSISALVLILTLLTGCNAFMEGFNKGLEGALEKDSEGVQTITSDQSQLSVDFPKSWKEEELNGIATIQMANMVKEQYMIVIEEAADDFEDGFTVGDYAEIIIENMQTVVSGATVSSIDDVTIGDNLAAKQVELSGSVDGIKCTYFITFAENDGFFYQFTAWSLPSKYDAAKSVFEDILKSVTF